MSQAGKELHDLNAITLIFVFPCVPVDEGQHVLLSAYQLRVFNLCAPLFSVNVGKNADHMSFQEA